MSVAVEIVSAILKSIVSNKVENELAKNLIEISSDSIFETYIPEIVKFIYEGKSQIEKVLSKENLSFSDNKCDFVVAEIKDLVSNIELTDEIYRKCKYNAEDLKNFLWSKYSELKGNNIEYENDIKKVLFLIAKELLTLKKESEEFETDLLIHISNTVDDTKTEVQKLFEDTNNNSNKLDKNAQILIQIQQILQILLEKIQTNNKDNDIINNKEFQNNKKKDYIKNWNSRLFLHVDNDENPLTLADTFITPDYKIHKQIKRIRFSNEDALDNVIDKFIKYDRTSTMLITGVPGIGKSSITSWIANRYKDNDRVLILRFRDWEPEELEKELLKAIYNTFGYKKSDLDNKILVIDGFDEIKLLYERDRLLDIFLNNITEFNNFKCIITSRPAYIHARRFENVIDLQEFGIDKVDSFYEKITGNNLKEKKKIESNLEVLGIPVILYMAIMSDVDIEGNPTKPELYNRIFAERGGIFDKFCSEGISYDKANQILRDPKNIKKYLKFLANIAFEMFESNTLLLQKEKSSIPELEIGEGKISVLEFPIKHLFESTEFNVEFIHKTIYEYFVSEYIFHSIYESIKLSTDKLAGVLGKLLKKNILSLEILEFLKYKIINSRLKDEFHILNESFDLMLQDGITYHTGICYKNSMDCEMNVFANMLEIIHMWDKDILEVDIAVVNYIQYNKRLKLNLKNLILEKAHLIGTNLSGANLSGANLSGANLTEANLSGANLSGVNLIGANLSGANLTEANLSGVNLIGANLSGANLTEANLSGANLSGTNLTEANLIETDLIDANLINAILDEEQVRYLEEQYNLEGIKIYLEKTKEIIGYEEYCNKRGNRTKIYI